ncbi:odorant receptor 85b-like [Anoplophora glabripennis]|uniref:odorant receptor 85b-like n=1 Tax=Anoplophora glabripennis TaxID=217634 RepID=UPI00087528D1|nr:odorant receptor 85b-like [Anoplophora glabripennis]
MSTIEDYDLRNAFKIERKLLLLCGIYPNEGRINKKLYNLSAFCHISFSLLITLSMVIFLAMNMKNILSVVEALLFLATQMAFLCKLFNVLNKKHKLLEIEDILANPAFYGYPKEKRHLIEDSVRFTKIFGMCYRSICTVVSITYAIFPLMDDDEWALPLSGWNPIQIDTKFKYWTIFTFQWVSYYMSVYINSGIDILIYILITVVTSQFEILKDNLTNIRYETDTAKRDFAKNVVLHYGILKLVRVIEDTFSYATFFQFFSSVVVICFTGFEMMIVPPNSIQFISMCTYFNAMIFQVAMYCWFGHSIIASSDKINDAIYMSNWYEADLSLKKSIMIFMEKCKKPVVLTAGKIFPLSLVTFTSIMRSSYSYLAVLQSMYGQE